MDFNRWKELAVKEAKRRNLTEYELYYAQEEMAKISAYQEKVKGFSSQKQGGICLRLIVDGRTGYASTELPDENQIGPLFDRALENASLFETASTEGLCADEETYGEKTVEAYDIPDIASLTEEVLALQKAAYAADARVSDGTESCVISRRRAVRLYNSRGLDLENATGYSAAFIEALVKQGDETNVGRSLAVGDMAQFDPDGMAREAAGDGCAKLGAVLVPSGSYPVVFDSRQMITFLEAFSGVFSAENAQKGLSLLSGLEGRQAAAGCVTLMEDPLCRFSPVQTPFDDEGTAVREKKIIDSGILTTLLYDQKAARAKGTVSTGNGIKDRYDQPIRPGHFCLYLKPGEKDREELCAGIKEGVLVNEIKGLHAGTNEVTGDFSIESAGFFIRDGKVSHPIKSFTVAGNFFDLLKDILAVGSDLRFGMPKGASVVGSPSVLISHLSVAGK